MRKIGILLLSVTLLFSSCYKDDIDDLNKKYDELKKEQERQAALLEAYKQLIDALENKLTITGIEKTADGYAVVFSDGTKLEVNNGVNGHTPIITIGENGNWVIDGKDTGKSSTGKDGSTPKLEIVDGFWHIDEVNTGIKAEAADGSDAPGIISIVDVGGTIIFYMSDGTTITMGKTVTTGLYVLSEGSWGMANGQLVYYDYNEETGKFVRNNDMRFRDYGETPNDLLIYGSKMYCAITGDTENGGLVRVINPATGATIEDIVINHENTPAQPRRLTAYGGNMYVTLYSGALAKLDTASFATSVINLSGTYSEGICSHGQLLYVCNSGQGEENTLSVVSTAPFYESDVITVPYNPVNIVSIGNNELYINTASVWSGPATGEPANLHVFNTVTNQLTHTFDLPVESIVAGKNYVYGTATTSLMTFEGILKKIAINNKAVSDFTTATSRLMFAYKLALNPLNGELFLTQQMGQGVARFSEDGTFIESLSVGQQNGAKIEFVNTVK